MVNLTQSIIASKISNSPHLFMNKRDDAESDEILESLIDCQSDVEVNSYFQSDIKFTDNLNESFE